MIDPNVETLLAMLSSRECETLLYLLKGFGEQMIGDRLGLSKQTVHVYVKNLYRTFRVRDRGELMAHFIPTTTVAHVEREVARRQ